MKHILVILFVAVASIVNAQTSSNVFYLHGFGTANGPAQVSPLASEMRNRFTGSPVPEKPVYCWINCSIASTASSVNTDLHSAHPTGQYFGVGYSAGGLVARSVEHLNFPTVTTPFLKALVSINTPHTGALVADSNEYKQLRTELAAADAIIKRTNTSGLGSWDPFLDLSTLAGTDFVANFYSRPFVADLAPSSSYISDINGSAKQTKESQMPNGKALVWSSITGRKLPGYQYGIVTPQAQYQTAIDQANLTSFDYGNQATRFAATHSFALSGISWRLPSNIDRAVYLSLKQKQRDYASTARAYESANASWEKHTSNLGPSDAFISSASQQGWPGVASNKKFKIDGIHDDGRPGDCNHGMAITSTGFDAVEAALKAVLFQ